MAVKKIRYQGTDIEIQMKKTDEQTVQAVINGKEFTATFEPIDVNTLSVSHDNCLYTVHFAIASPHVYVFVNGEQFLFEAVEKDIATYQPGREPGGETGNRIGAPMPGRILKVFVTKGQKIQKNERLFIVEAMKMENEVKSPREGIISQINFRENDLVSVGETVIELQP